jgi:hypothetical protein
MARGNQTRRLSINSTLEMTHHPDGQPLSGDRKIISFLYFHVKISRFSMGRFEGLPDDGR